jgi:outer membrane protein assembly factor BamB
MVKLQRALQVALVLPSAMVCRGATEQTRPTVYAVDAKTGETQWTVDTAGSVWRAPVVSGGLLLFACTDSHCYGVDPKSGETKWRFKAGGPLAMGVAATESTVFFGSLDGWLYAVDIQTGALRWRAGRGIGIRCTPAVQGDRVYVGFDSSSGNRNPDFYYWGLRSLDVATGAFRAKGYEIKVRGTLTLHEHMLYYGMEDDRVKGADVATVRGEEGMRRVHGIAFPGWSEGAAVAAPGDIFAGSWEGNVYARSGPDPAWVAKFRQPVVEMYPKDMNRKQELYWTFKTEGGVFGLPLATRDTVYVGSDDRRLYAIDRATGKERWRFETGDWVRSTPVAADGVVYFGSWDGHLYALDAESGKEKWRCQTGRWVCWPVVQDGVVYVGCAGRVMPPL